MWLGVGWLCVALGAAGAVLPILPTTPFLLLAAYAFARSSPRVHAWLMEHKLFGPPIRDWREQGAISAPAKRLAVSSMAAVLVLSVLFGVARSVLIIQAVVLIGAATFILTRPSPGPKRSDVTPPASPE